MRRLAYTVLAVAAGQPAFAQESATTVSVTTGIDYSTGDYGSTEDTSILVAPVSARVKTGDWRFSATLPYLVIDGAASIVGGDGGPIIIDPNAPAVRRDGWGDLSLGATYTALKEETAGFNVDLGASVKLATASASDGLGTGATDFSVSVDVSKSFGDWSPFVTVGYRMPGDPDGLELDNAYTASIGTSVIIGESVAILSYDHRQATSPLAEDSQEVFGAFSAPMGPVNWTLYGSAGLSEGAPDFGAGLMLTFRAS